jgi:hypothetical protein
MKKLYVNPLRIIVPDSGKKNAAISVINLKNKAACMTYPAGFMVDGKITVLL